MYVLWCHMCLLCVMCHVCMCDVYIYINKSMYVMCLVLQEMRACGLGSDVVVYLELLDVYARAGLWTQALALLKEQHTPQHISVSPFPPPPPPL